MIYKIATTAQVEQMCQTGLTILHAQLATVEHVMYCICHADYAKLLNRARVHDPSQKGCNQVETRAHTDLVKIFL